jgi:sulfoxide reductase heme-binding subunit YedZ
MKPIHVIGLKLIIHLGSLIPLMATFYNGIYDELGGDPVEAILHFTGIGAFNLLLLSLLVSPAAKYFRQGLLIQVRRLLGLYAFTYALFHLLSFIVFELQFEWGLVLSEIIDRPYITVGFLAFLILFSLTATSTKAVQRKMKRNWQNLHNWVYLAILLIALHYIWSVKSDLVQPLIYWLLTIFLLYQRKDKVLLWYKRRVSKIAIKKAK